MPAPVIRHWTGPFGLTYTIPATMNRQRDATDSREWGNANGSQATKAKQRHLARVAVFLGLEWEGPNAYRAVCGCMVAAFGGTGSAYQTVEADRCLAPEGPYGEGLVIPVCGAHNGNPDTRREVIGTLRVVAERVARHWGK